MNNRFLFIAVNFCSFLFFFSSVLSASEWSTRITTEEGTYEFGGPLLEKEKPLVGKWKGQNKNGDAWEILRRPNHVYTIMISWMEEGNKEIFRGHGLWSVSKDEFIYVDLLDRDGETDFEWPVEMKYRISNDDIMVLVENIKSASDQKVVTYAEDVGESTETRVENFKQLWMKQFDQAEPLEEARLFDQIQLARIVDIQGIVDFFTDPAYAVDRKMAGKWESTDNDPDAETDWKTEVIRRAEKACSDWIIDRHPEAALALSAERVRAVRTALLRERPDYLDNLTALRQDAMARAFTEHGFSTNEARKIAEEAFLVFHRARNQVTFFPGALGVLEQLADSYQLGALTNGNADLQQIGIAELFTFHHSAETIGKRKPAPDMFLAALASAGVDASQAVHVGDHPLEDVHAAREHGMHAI